MLKEEKEELFNKDDLSIAEYSKTDKCRNVKGIEYKRVNIKVSLRYKDIYVVDISYFKDEFLEADETTIEFICRKDGLVPEKTFLLRDDFTLNFMEHLAALNLVESMSFVPIQKKLLSLQILLRLTQIRFWKTEYSL